MKKAAKKKTAKKKGLYPAGSTRQQRMGIAARRLAKSHVGVLGKFDEDYYYGSGADRRAMKQTGAKSLLGIYGLKSKSAVNPDLLTKRSSKLVKRMFLETARQAERDERRETKKAIRKTAKKKAARKKTTGGRKRRG